MNAGANVALLRGETDDALALVERGLEISPSQALLWRTQGTIHQARGETALAAAAFAKADQFDPS